MKAQREQKLIQEMWTNTSEELGFTAQRQTADTAFKPNYLSEFYTGVVIHLLLFSWFL